MVWDGVRCMVDLNGAWLIGGGVLNEPWLIKGGGKGGGPRWVLVRAWHGGN